MAIEPAPFDVARLLEGLSADECLELGVSITARGLFRKKEAAGAKEAAASAMSVVSTFRSAALDLHALAARDKS